MTLMNDENDESDDMLKKVSRKKLLKEHEQTPEEKVMLDNLLKKTNDMIKFEQDLSTCLNNFK